MRGVKVAARGVGEEVGVMQGSDGVKAVAEGGGHGVGGENARSRPIDRKIFAAFTYPCHGPGSMQLLTRLPRNYPLIPLPNRLSKRFMEYAKEIFYSVYGFVY